MEHYITKLFLIKLWGEQKGPNISTNYKITKIVNEIVKNIDTIINVRKINIKI